MQIPASFLIYGISYAASIVRPEFPRRDVCSAKQENYSEPSKNNFHDLEIFFYWIFYDFLNSWVWLRIIAITHTYLWNLELYLSYWCEILRSLCDRSQVLAGFNTLSVIHACIICHVIYIQYMYLIMPL